MIILEYANNGSLRQYLKTNFQKMDWNTKLNLAKQIANVLMYLHSNEIIHGKLVIFLSNIHIQQNVTNELFLN
jgi:serine/threonine protein kinase